jgi:hypothetical protein
MLAAIPSEDGDSFNLPLLLARSGPVLPVRPIACRVWPVAAALSLLLFLPLMASAQPVPGSPGGHDLVTIPDPCPTFGWSPAVGVDSYELVVFRLEDEAAELPSEPVLRRQVTGGLTLWTPSLAECLEPGGEYAWAVRSRQGDAWSAWSEALLFRVPAAPTAAEVERALAVLRAYSAIAERLGEGWDASNAAAGEPTADSQSVRSPLIATALAIDGGPPATSPAPTPPGNPSAGLTVEGEVRTVDSSGAPRLWGRGRAGVVVYAQAIVGGYCLNSSAGNVHFGLSNVMVDWSSAADACPAGTWVCSVSELQACNTARPSQVADDRLCDGTGFDEPENAQPGWTAETSTLAAGFDGRAFKEDGSSGSSATCSLLPVWCCW